jgi:hypothetical protein
MSRTVRRVPMDWMHPVEWRKQWDRAEGRAVMKRVSRPLFDDYPGALAYWEAEGVPLARREGWAWKFHVQYHLTGYQSIEGAEPKVHPFEVDEDTRVDVRDLDHLHELLMARHASDRPDPANHMPEFPEGTATGWCMYETTSEGTPISPVFATPEELARWLADTGASSFGSSTATYEQWLATINAGWAPSAVATSAGVTSGVEFGANTQHNEEEA